MLPGTLYLVPSGLGGAAPGRFLPEATAAIVRELRHFVVEDAKTARAFLKAIAYPLPLRSASFAVLKAPDVPSILVETAFISNPQEEKRLNDDAYQDRLARALLEGIRDYIAKHPPRPLPLAMN